MHVEEREYGEFRIQAVALPVSPGSYVAGVTVLHVRSDTELPQRVFFNDNLSDGHRFKDAAAAVRHAFDVGHYAARMTMARA